MRKLPTLLFAAATAAALPVSATMVAVTVENLASPGGLYFSPVWLGFHDGSYDLFDAGTAASPAVELIAELGDSSMGMADLLAADPSGLNTLVTNPSGPGGVIFSPGSSTTIMLDLDPMDHRYLALGAMLVPSNDTFFGIDDPMSAELFDAAGHLATSSWTFSASMAYDSGTEVNDFTFGAAFVDGNDPLEGFVEGGMVHPQDATTLAGMLGLMTVAGTTISSIEGDILRVSFEVVPEPGMVGPLAGLFLFLPLTLRRRRRR